jgi:prepilin-type N-terminal cleavage/methylation domain-containing protein
MSARLADERGFTLAELMATMVVGGIILFALYGLVDTATRRQSMATDRIDANDRARAAMDIIGSQLRSRVCISATQGAIVSASPTVLEFYTSLGLTPESTTVSQRPIIQRRRLSYDAAKSEIVEEMWVSTAVSPGLPPASTTTPTRKRTLITNVVAPEAETPLFDYAQLGDVLTGLPIPEVDLEPTLTALQLAAQSQLKVRIDLRFETKGRVAGVSTPLQDEILDRSPGCYFG